MTLSNAAATVLGIATLALAVQAGAEWQYTDSKGKTKTVVLRMDVPSQYMPSAREIVGESNRSTKGAAPYAPPTDARGEAIIAQYNQIAATRNEIQQQAAASAAIANQQRGAVEVLRIQSRRSSSSGSNCVDGANATALQETRMFGSASRQEHTDTIVRCMTKRNADRADETRAELYGSK